MPMSASGRTKPIAPMIATNALRTSASCFMASGVEVLYRLLAAWPFWVTAAFTSALNARASTFSASWMSIALRVLPSKLALKRRDGSGTLAPRANVSFTTFVYASPVQTIPSCDQTGFVHFHSSVISGSAARISARMRASVSPRHPPRSRIRWSISREAGFPPAPGGVACLRLLDLRGLLARDAPLAFGFAMLSIIICPLLLDIIRGLQQHLVGPIVWKTVVQRHGPSTSTIP